MTGIVIAPHACTGSEVIGYVHLSSVVCRLSPQKLPDPKIQAS